MKIRRLADAALVAALLLSSRPADALPEEPPAPCAIPAHPDVPPIPAPAGLPDIQS